MARKTLEDLFVHALSDICSAKKQLTQALRKLSGAATNERLSRAFETYRRETRGQVERIDQVLESAACA